MDSKPFRITRIFYIFIVYFFLYMPILVLIIFSFNKSRINAVWTGFTLDWYKKLADDTSILEAAKNSLMVAFVSTILSTMVGTLASVGMYKYKFKGKTLLDGLLYIPIVIPEIVMGIAMLSFLSIVNFPLGMFSIILAHVTFSIPFVVVVVRARLDGFDRFLEEAAMDLGANQLQTFFKVTFPVIMPGIVAGALLACTLSLDDVIISFFVGGPGSTTLPLKVFSMVKFGVSPEINALSTILLLFTLTIGVLSEKGRFKKKNEEKNN